MPSHADVDRYLESLLVPADDALDAALAASEKAGLPAIAVSPTQGKLLSLVAMAIGAKRVLEVGTLGGYSGIWLARALPPGGHLVTLEIDPRHAVVARESFARAKVDDRAEVRVGAALDLLPKLAEEGGAPFDLVFIDADKENNAAYFEWALRLARPGAVVVIDNVVRGGAVADPSSHDPRVEGTRRALERVGREPRVDATAVQTVGMKGHDGFVFAVVRAR